MIKALLLLSLSLYFPSAAMASCPPGACMPFGICVLEETPECKEFGTCQEKCVCQDGFTGRDCSTMIEICPIKEEEQQESDEPSVPSCYNGGQCFPEPNADGTDFSWRCDCSAAGFGDVGRFQGHQCQFRDDPVSCEIGKHVSIYAYCLNGGECGEHIVESGSKEHFMGCTCPSGFEGKHCQIASGRMPDSEFLLYAPELKLGAGTIVTITLVVLVAVLGLVHHFVVVRPRRQVGTQHVQDKARAVGGNMTMDADDTTQQLDDIDLEETTIPAMNREIL